MFSGVYSCPRGQWVLAACQPPAPTPSGSQTGTTGRSASCRGDAPSRAGRSRQLRTAGRTPCVRERCPRSVRGRILPPPSPVAIDRLGRRERRAEPGVHGCTGDTDLPCQLGRSRVLDVAPRGLHRRRQSSLVVLCAGTSRLAARRRVRTFLSGSGKPILRSSSTVHPALSAALNARTSSRSAVATRSAIRRWNSASSRSVSSRTSVTICRASATARMAPFVLPVHAVRAPVPHPHSLSLPWSERTRTTPHEEPQRAGHGAPRGSSRGRPSRRARSTTKASRRSKLYT